MIGLVMVGGLQNIVCVGWQVRQIAGQDARQRGVGRPIHGHPAHGRVETAHGDVSFPSQRGQLLAVAEHAARQSRLRKIRGRPVQIGNVKKGVFVEHHGRILTVK